MKRLPDLARWERICRSNDPSAAKVALREAGWGPGMGGSVLPVVQQGVDRCWLVACQESSDRVLSCLEGFGFLPSDSPLVHQATDELLSRLSGRGLSCRKDQSVRAWGLLLPHLVRFTDEQASLLAVAGRSRDLLELLGREAWVPRSGPLLYVMEQLKEQFSRADLFDLMEYVLNRFPDLGTVQPQASLQWLRHLVEEHAYRGRSGELDQAQLQLRVLDGLLASIVAGQGVEALRKLPGEGSLLLLACTSDDLALVTLLGRHGCDPCWLEATGTPLKFFKRLLLVAPPKQGPDPRCEVVPWREWVRSDLASDQLEELEAYRGKVPDVVRTWSSWRLEKALENQPISEPTRRARL